MTTRHHLCLLSPLPRRTSGSWQEKEAKREQDSYKGPFTKVWARGRGSQRGGEGPKRVHRAGAAGLGPQGEDRRERAGLCPAVRELGKFPNLWAEVQTHPEARGEWGDGATDDAVAGGGGKPGIPSPLLCRHLFPSRAEGGHTLDRPPAPSPVLLPSASLGVPWRRELSEILI